ncbi:MAG: hypothetical protein J1E00_00555 [Oscillospiraceae bacterium]|nr:hypothetical protein [Oscillospiraceae bacterium]
MKKIGCFLLCALLMVTAVSGAMLPTSAEESSQASAQESAFRLSGVSDVTGADGTRSYQVYAPYTDTYSLSSKDTVSISLSKEGEILAEGETSLTAELTEGAVYTLTVQTEQANSPFVLAAQADNHLITLPYDVGEPVDVSSIPLEGDGSDPLKAAEVSYQKRGGGTYIYCNNPESIPAEMVGNAFIRTENLTGDVYFTFEHSNHAGYPIYLGYQLKNTGDSDVYVTVTNIGYQTVGTWLGQEAWDDFYNVSFQLPDYYFENIGQYAADYGYVEYTARVFQPVTYRLPAGEYFYVIGGTTEDAYQHISVDGTADVPVESVRCASGNVKFTVTGGSVTGSFYAYSDIAQVKAEPEQLGYVAGEFARQYVGAMDHAGVVDSYITWTFSDKTRGGALPVTYTVSYDENLPAVADPYTAYNSTPHTVNGKNWVTHLNPQNEHKAIGSDMVAFSCVDQNGNKVVLDNDHADGAGKPGNFGNWMIEYQDHFTLVNQGDTDRVVTLTTKDNGSLAMLARDGVTGEILQADLTVRNSRESNYAYEVTVPAHSVKQITLDYVLLGNSYGCVVHAATLSRYVKPAVDPSEDVSGEESGEPSGGGEASTSDGAEESVSDGSEEDAGAGKSNPALLIAIPALVVAAGVVVAVLCVRKRKHKG